MAIKRQNDVNVKACLCRSHGGALAGQSPVPTSAIDTVTPWLARRLTQTSGAVLLIGWLHTVIAIDRWPFFKRRSIRSSALFGFWRRRCLLRPYTIDAHTHRAVAFSLLEALRRPALAWDRVSNRLIGAVPDSRW
jgi:hypothetical protein